MSVEIIRDSAKIFNRYTVDEIRDGRAYEDRSGVIYIVNKIGDIIGFSICGQYVIRKSSFEGIHLREVNLKIHVE